MATIVLVMTVQVVARYLVGSSLIWAEELCRYLLIWQTFLVLGLAYSKGEFVSIDFARRFFSPRLWWLFKSIMALPIIGFCGLLAYYGADFASRFDRQTIPALDFIWETLSGEPLGLSVKYVYLSVTVGMTLLAIHVIAMQVATFRSEFVSDPRDDVLANPD